jgi:hypothetical protein
MQCSSIIYGIKHQSVNQSINQSILRLCYSFANRTHPFIFSWSAIIGSKLFFTRYNDRQSSEQNNRKSISLQNNGRTKTVHTNLQISSCWEHISTWNMLHSHFKWSSIKPNRLKWRRHNLHKVILHQFGMKIVPPENTIWNTEGPFYFISCKNIQTPKHFY